MDVRRWWTPNNQMANLSERPGGSFSERSIRPGASGFRRPFWLPALSYYMLAIAVSAVFAFLVWGVLNDSGEESPMLTAGVSGIILLFGAVILREVILRRARNRVLSQHRELDMRVYGVHNRMPDSGRAGKLTLEKNASFLAEIKQKSDAAKVLNKISSGHREVFELCREYLVRIELELRNIGAGSPRLAPLLKGRSTVADYHHYHLLQWAEIEARTLTGEANNKTGSAERVEAAQNALGVIGTALDSYPSEARLLQSQEILRELVVSIKVSDWVEKAERAAFKGDYAEAKSHFRDALFDLGRDNVQSLDREQAAAVINQEIDRLRKLQSGE
ncbi:hypothetical protein BH10ACI3_BH10ACI3_14110 [soil metagenome]